MAMESDLHNVFVYGTLKRGEPNQHWLANRDNGSATFIGEAKTSVPYPLVIASKYNIPFLIDKPGTGQFVTGEVYNVDDKMLKNLDILEDYPAWYVREKRPFKLLGMNEEEEIIAWVYLLQTFKESLLQLPFQTDYRSMGSHGLLYCEPTLRDGTYDACADVQGTSNVK